MKHFLLWVRITLISCFIILFSYDGFAMIHFAKTCRSSTAPYTIICNGFCIKKGSQSIITAALDFPVVDNSFSYADDFDKQCKTEVGYKITLLDPFCSGSYGYGGNVAFTKVGAFYVATPPPASFL